MNLTLTPSRFLERARQLFANKVGIVDGDVRLTYGQYAERCDQLSNALGQLGIRRGQCVAWLGYNSHELLEAYYGVVQMGAVLLPLNIRLTPPELAFILKDSETVALFYNRDFAPLVEALRQHAPTVKHYVALEPEASGDAYYEDLLRDARAEFTPPDDIKDDDLAELFYTSGTTANPKGVMMTHRNLYLHGMSAMAALQIEDDLVQLHTIPLFHVNGWGTPQYVTCQGGKHVMMRKFECKTICELTEREKVSRILMVPTMATALVNFPGLKNYDMSSVRFMNIGGAASPVELIREVEEKIGGVCVAGYGLT